MLSLCIHIKCAENWSAILILSKSVVIISPLEMSISLSREIVTAWFSNENSAFPSGVNILPTFAFSPDDTTVISSLILIFPEEIVPAD